MTILESMETEESPRLLLVEDDLVIGEATKLNLERHRYDVTWVVDGLDAWEAYRAPHGKPFDLVLSDIMLPGMDGVTLCRRVRERANTPYVLISARTDAIDIVSGLEAGADDYVTKPFDIQVLLARLRSVLRRAEPPEPESAAGAAVTETFGDVTLDRAALQVRRDGRLLALTPTEMRLFLELVDAHGAVVSSRTLLSRVWEYDEWADDSHVVTVHVQRLRAKIGAERIETVRGFGYKLAR
ncbi:response regulator transcription factor [Spelaeicoccus albus]|uniref:DNA-binding response OmpR family regulator n=1 Tax=Spelaeicoccus albus TaxID=1280376 RepID=A0A7Z0CZE8_9MICO|nr:response regulator transcription factor [Spelaeicoccus albus]NYI66204.1 DNA-binding response OmpR family regulator [Spelaeicoccus albus]